MWERLLEASSVLPSMSQTVPSERSSVSNTAGIGDRSEIGRSPVSGQAKLLGNLNGQSRGFEGRLDTQGKSSPELFTSHKGSTKSNDPGTYTPQSYKNMLRLNEAANGDETGIASAKHKHSSAAGYGNPLKTHTGSDSINGGGCNKRCCNKSESVTESQLMGSAVALAAIQTLSEMYNAR